MGLVSSILHRLYLKTFTKIAWTLDTKQHHALLNMPHRSGGIKIAFICDEMTWQDFSVGCDAIFLHPFTWLQQLDRFCPDVFFCESTWSGIDRFKNCWRGRVYRDQRVQFENREILLNILTVCHQRGIPCVFWSKEDPTYFDHPVYNFTETARLFDFVFTTAQECVAKYRAAGVEQVAVLPFGVNTQLFNPAGYHPQKNTVMFAGSWFSEHTERCYALERLLDYTLERGLTLDIYDRKSNSKERRFRFPEKYSSYLRNAVPFCDMPLLIKRYAYAINVNTVTASETMLSRRILQLAACGVTVISNPSKGFETLSDCLTCEPSGQKGVVFLHGNPQMILERHASTARLQRIVEVVSGIPILS